MKDLVHRRRYSLILVIFLLTACDMSFRKKEITLKEYDLTRPEKFNMPENLSEISGITLYQGKNDTVYAVQDEEGKVFRLAWDIKKQYHAKFGKKGDYEDISITGGKIIVLKSNGSIYSFKFEDAIYDEVDNVEEWKDLLPPGEYEGMHADETSGDIYVICKNCEKDKDKNTVSGYILKGGDSLFLKDSFSIDVEEIKSFTGKVRRGFRPSGIARNPLTKDWYIISSVNKLVIVADSNWKIKEVSRLNGNRFNQPEGICFDKKGNLYISSEGDDITEGNILKFLRAGNQN